MYDIINAGMKYSHKWTESLYDQVLKTIRDGEKPMTQTIKKRSKIYSYDPESKSIVYVHRGPLPWMKKNGIVMIQHAPEHIFYVIRPSEKMKILESYMDDPKFLTLGIYTLYDKIVKDKYLNISRSDVKAFLQSSQVVRMSRIRHVKPVKQSYLPEYVFQQWQMDLVDLQAFKKYNKNYAWILICVDIFSKYTYGFPLYKKSGNEIKTCLEHLFLSGDIPERLQHDNEATFQSNEISDLFKQMNIVRIVNDSYSPQTNGIVENKIKFLKRLINSHFQTYQTSQWIDILQRVLFNLNTTKHSVTDFSPLEVHRGRAVSINNKTSISLEESNVFQASGVSDYVTQKLKEEQARNLYIQKEIKRKKERINKRKQSWEPEIGDRVYLPYELKDSSGIITFLIQRRLEKRVIKYNSTDVLTLKKFGKKLVQKYYPNVFRIIEKGKDSERGPFYYLLKDEQKEGQIEYMTDASKNKISTRFYPEQMFYISEPAKKHKTFDYIDPIVKYTKPEKIKQFNLKSRPKSKWVGLKIFKAWKVDNSVEWFSGTIKKYHSSRERFKFDIRYPGETDVHKEDLLDGYYSKMLIPGNWYFEKEEIFLS